MKPQLLNQYIKFLNQRDSQLGFTLVELLLASFMSLFVVWGAGYGLVAVLNANNSTEAKTQRQIELNRALDFISEEVKMSKNITCNNDCTTSTKNQLILSIANPASTNTYSTASSSTTASIWLKDFVVNRKENSNPNQVLVDALVVPSASDITIMTNACTGTDKALVNTAQGFYACIYDYNTTITGIQGRRVDLYLYGKIGSKTTDYVKVKTTAFARAN